MNPGKYIKTSVVVAAVSLLGACSGLTPFTKIDGSNADNLARMDGSWTVINMGGVKVENLTPPAVLVFDTKAHKLSGFDGCNDIQGNFSFERGLLKAQVSSTRRACTSEQARTVSARIQDLLSHGAEVVDTTFMQASVLMLKNANGDVRMGRTEQLHQR